MADPTKEGIPLRDFSRARYKEWETVKTVLLRYRARVPVLTNDYSASGPFTASLSLENKNIYVGIKVEMSEMDLFEDFDKAFKFALSQLYSKATELAPLSPTNADYVSVLLEIK